MQQNGSGETPEALRSVTREAVSIEPSEGLSSRVPVMRVVIGRICHAYSSIERVVDKDARTKCWLYQVLELDTEVRWLVRPVAPWRLKRNG